MVFDFCSSTNSTLTQANVWLNNICFSVHRLQFSHFVIHAKYSRDHIESYQICTTIAYRKIEFPLSDAFNHLYSFEKRMCSTTFAVQISNAMRNALNIGYIVHIYIFCVFNWSTSISATMSNL